MGTSAAALKRWRRKGERERMSKVMRSRFHPKLKVGVTPNLSGDLPAEVTQLLDTLGNEALDIVECSPLRVKRNTVWRVALIDGNDIALNERYYPLVREHGLHLYRIHSRPLHHLGGVSVVLFVGLAKGDI